jgi:hypothetical protein
MKRTLALLAIGLLFGGGIGFLTATANGVALQGHSHEVPDGHGAEVPMKMEHSHGAGMAIPADGDAPSVNISVIKDPMAGWNLHVMPANFRFAPENASKAHIDGEGHAHVYVNGTKLARLYGPWMHLTNLPKGDTTIEVVLNSNDHRPLMVNDKKVSASVSVTVE